VLLMDAIVNMFAARVWAWQGTDLTFMARAQGQDATNNLLNLQQAHLTSITYTVYDAATGLVVVAATPLVVATVMFNALQLSTIWTADAIGFNFLCQLAAAANFPLPLKTYLAVFTFTLTTGKVFPLVFEVFTRNPATGVSA
jgi:hypothetical protein